MKKYTKPTIEYTVIELNDVITVSVGQGDGTPESINFGTWIGISTD